MLLRADAARVAVNTTAGRLQGASEHFEQRGFANPVAAHERNAIAVLQAQL
jgi:hypothetical protein